MAKPTGAKYRVLAGINYPPDKRAEIGDIVTDLPGSDIRWLVECGAIQLITEESK